MVHLQIFSNLSWLSFEGNFKYSSSLGAGVILRSTELQRFPSKLKIFSEVYRHKVFPYKLSHDQEMFSPLTKRGALTFIKKELCITWKKVREWLWLRVFGVSNIINIFGARGKNLREDSWNWRGSLIYLDMRRLLIRNDYIFNIF